jgi:hypothetical protein
MNSLGNQKWISEMRSGTKLQQLDLRVPTHGYDGTEDDQGLAQATVSMLMPEHEQNCTFDLKPSGERSFAAAIKRVIGTCFQARHAEIGSASNEHATGAR